MLLSDKFFIKSENFTLQILDKFVIYYIISGKVVVQNNLNICTFVHMSVKGGLYMLKVFKNEKLWCAVAGAAAVIVGKKILKADKTRSLAVTGLAKGMKLQKDAKAAFQNMKDEASDICYDAKTEAGIHEDAAAEEVTE